MRSELKGDNAPLSRSEVKNEWNCSSPPPYMPSCYEQGNILCIFLILNFRRVLIVVSFLLGRSPASAYYCMPTFRNSLSVPSSKAMVEH